MRRLTVRAAWAPLSVLVFHAAGGRAFGHEPFVDPIAHFSGGMAVAYFFRSAGSIAGRWLGSPTRAAVDLLAFCLSCAAALLWECGEFASDRYLGTRVQRGDTIRDLGLGVIGVLVFLAAKRVIGSGVPRG